MPEDKTVYRVRMNGAMAAVVISIVVCSFGTWLALVMTKTISVDSIRPFLTHLAVFVTTALAPGIFSLWKEKRLIFDVSSDPPNKDEEK